MRIAALALCCSAALALAPSRADACGCFTPPDPVVPLVQSGERIVFAVANGQVTAHVQVQYDGAAGDFGWLLPLPAVPTLELGTDELFARLIAQTQPRYWLSTSFDSSCSLSFGGSGGGAGGGAASGGGFAGVADAGAAAPSPLVVQDSVGPYDYAVLRADSKDAMLQWLADNRYFVPAGTDAAVAPYVRPGAFFLALKLRPGNSTGDLQPVVLRYAGDVGSIPITLTSTGASRNMGVLVWMLGPGRAIPRNYLHTVLNDALIDWRSNGANYDDVIIRAVSEAPQRHTFVTEYAGTSALMKGQLASPTRFGTKAELAAQPTAEAFVQRLFLAGFAQFSSLTPFGGPVLSGPLKGVLTQYLPPPPGVTPDTFYSSYGYFLSLGQAPPQDYQPQAMADAIWERVVAPALAAEALFADGATLTRLFTRLSPADMNVDPAFSFNPALPDVSNVHRANMHVTCGNSGAEGAAVLTTEAGYRIQFPDGRFGAPGLPLASFPASARIEILREEGPAELLVNNAPTLGAAMADLPAAPRGCGCSAARDPLLLLGLAALAWRRRQR